MGEKRKRTSVMGSVEGEARASPFLEMFTVFRSELDEHHDRRERVVKASRDITAASKKIIFALQRVRNLNEPVQQNISKATQPHDQINRTLFAAVTPDLQAINAYRYQRQISPGIQEYMEALLFQHYLETQSLLSYERARQHLNSFAGQVADGSVAGHLLLTPEDYILAIFDMTGELMRFAITSMATSGNLPATARPEEGEGAQEQPYGLVDQQRRRRTVLRDLQMLRLQLSALDARSDFDFHTRRDLEKKLEVLLNSVEKVEKALYGLVVRGSERPKGWIPDVREEGRGPESETLIVEER